MGKKRLTKAQRAMRDAAKEWRRMSQRKKAAFEGGFRDFAKVYIEARIRRRRR
ncbi:MAG: hypothetical protein QW721_01045 [Desulfurococcaceae archaeon]